MFATCSRRLNCCCPLLKNIQIYQRRCFKIAYIDYRTNFSNRRRHNDIHKLFRTTAAAAQKPPLLLARKFVHDKANVEQLWLLRFGRLLWSKMFGKYLFITNVLGSGVLMVVGDVVAQEYEYRRGLRSEDGFDYERIWRMFIAGALQGPLHHWVYNWMDRVMPQRTFRSTINKILIDQIVMSPVCIVVFFYSMCFLENQSLDCTNRELMQKFPYIYLLDWMTWPAAQYINFRYVDLKYRVAFVNICTAVYNVFMSYMKHDFGMPIPEDVLSVKGQEQKSVADKSLSHENQMMQSKMVVVKST